MSQTKISAELIASFLEGRDPQKYITSIEVPYHVAKADLIINDPEQGKYIQSKSFKPFLWMKEEVATLVYDGDRKKIKAAAKKYGVKFKSLTTTNEDGFEPQRLKDGYKFLAQTDQCYSSLISFFRGGDIDIYSEQHRHLFMAITPVEQFMIQTGKRLFKGMEDYDDVHKFQFDLETRGLDPKTAPIFQIGMRDNRGFEEIIEVTGDTPAEQRESEREAIMNFFKIIDYLKPDIITGYNSENFDWDYFDVRADKLGFQLKDVVITLDNEKGKYTRKDSRIKLGGMTENYKQTHMWGYSILDIWHAVRKAKAINSEIKLTSLKYITKFSKIAKPNRVYVPGDMLHTIWADKENSYFFNETNGDWFKYIDPNTEGLSIEVIDGQSEKVNSPDYQQVMGNFIVRRYLLDDLWETEKVDGIFNQATFLVSKILPTSFMRAATMGTAGTWKLIMMAWSYENGLAIPALEPKRAFTGGLSRLNEVGFAKRVAKLDYAALYPNIELTHDIFPDIDITGVMKGLLFYVVDQRDTYKFLKGDHSTLAKEFKAKLAEDPNNEEYKLKYTENDYLSSKYDKKQLPLKILANSFFGSFGASYLFNWGDVDCAEETTCRGRQYLRLMVRHFYEKYGFRPLVGDSVTFDTPIYIKHKDSGEIDIKPICDIFEEVTTDIEGQQRDFKPKDFEILTRNGWKDIKYVYRHKTDKKMFDIRTRDRHIRVTEDHSIFANGKKVLPSKLKVGDKIDVYEIPKFNDSGDISIDKAWLLGIFVGDGSSVCGRRNRTYFSKRKQENVNYRIVRQEWTLNNQNLDLLERSKKILLKEFGVSALIKDYSVSSNTHKLKTHNKELSKWFSENCYTSNRQKKVPQIILNATEDVKRAFLEGFICADGYGMSLYNSTNFYQKSLTAVGGLTYLMKCSGIEHNIGLKNHHYKKLGKIGLTINVPKQVKYDDGDIIRWKEDYSVNGEEYVYDVSTEDGSFIAGVNGVSCSNTDGYNFAIPDTVDEISYKVEGSHRLTKEFEGQTLTGLKAVVADFNEKYMIGRMGLDIDDICESTINFSRKNYGNKIDGKVKLVGNTIKSSKLPGYIEKFLNEGIKLLLDDKGKEFVELYYEKVDDIFNYKIPLAQMASKSKVNQTMDEYKKYCAGKNKAGNLNSRKAFMELLKAHEITPNLGDIVYYVNTGDTKSQGDLKAVKDEKGKIVDVQLSCKMIPTDQLEKNPNLTTDEYNVPKYLNALNKRITPLLVCFDYEIRDKLLIETKKNRKTKEIELTERHYFTTEQCKLVSGKPMKDGDQDSYDELMTLDDKEIRFWDDVNKVPNNMEVEEWETIRKDWKERKEQEIVDGIEMEKTELIKCFDNMKPSDFELLFSHNIIKPEILRFVGLERITDDEGNMVGIGLISHKFGKRLFFLSDMLAYEPIAVLREEFWATLPEGKLTEEEKDVKWKNHIETIAFKEGGEFLDDMINNKWKEIRPSEYQKSLDTPKVEEEPVESQELPTVEVKLYDIVVEPEVVETDFAVEVGDVVFDNEEDDEDEWNF